MNYKWTKRVAIPDKVSPRYLLLALELILVLVAAVVVPRQAQAETIVYIPLGKANEVIAVDAATNKIIARYPGVKNPHGLVATPDGDYLVASSLDEVRTPGPDKGDSYLYLIHPEHGHVMSRIKVKGWSHHEAITPDGRYVISTHPMQSDISVVDLRTNRVVHVIKTGPVPNYTVITRDGRRAYVSNSGNGTISEISLRDWKVTRTLQAGQMPEHIVFSPDEKDIYVANARAGDISVVDVKKGVVVKRFKVGAAVHGLDIGDDGKTLFVTSKKENKLVAIDIRTGAQKTLTLSPSPYHLNTIHGMGVVYVSSSKKPIIWVVEQKTLKVKGIIRLPAGEGHQMAIVR